MKTTQLAWLHFVVMLGLASRTQAQEAPRYPAGYPTEWKVEASGVLGATATYPQKLTLDASLLLGPARSVSGFEREARGGLLSAEAGLGGLKVGLGYARLQPFDAGISGYAIRIVGLRTWGARWGVTTNSTFLGPEALYYFSVVRVNLGILRYVAGSPAKDWLITGGVGLCWQAW